jgi:hypothetical protein
MVISRNKKKDNCSTDILDKIVLEGLTGHNAYRFIGYFITANSAFYASFYLMFNKAYPLANISSHLWVKNIFLICLALIISTLNFFLFIIYVRERKLTAIIQSEMVEVYKKPCVLSKNLKELKKNIFKHDEKNLGLTGASINVLLSFFSVIPIAYIFNISFSIQRDISERGCLLWNTLFVVLDISILWVAIYFYRKNIYKELENHSLFIFKANVIGSILIVGTLIIPVLISYLLGINHFTRFIIIYWVLFTAFILESPFYLFRSFVQFFSYRESNDN